ncbi:zinc ribbon domain-containing protein, partial [bacterium]|nr:zinc ribbon domain-containing protein [bacterium]
RERFRRNLRTAGLGLLLAAAGLILVLQGGAVGIFFGIPLGAGGLIAFLIGFIGFLKDLLVPPRRFTCPRCRTEQNTLRDLPWITCIECGLPLIFLDQTYLSHIHCVRCKAEFGVGVKQDAPVACPDCGQVHLVTGGEVQRDGENREELALKDFAPGGPYSGERGELRLELLSDRGQVYFAERVSDMLAEKNTAVVWGELIARLRALRLALHMLSQAAQRGVIKTAPEYWPKLRNSIVNTVYAWARYLELTGPHEFRINDVPVEFPLGEMIEYQHELASLSGFGEPWDLEAAALEERPRWFGTVRLVLTDFQALERLARGIDPDKDMPALQHAERERLVEIFSLERLPAKRRRRVEETLGERAGEAVAFCDLTPNLSARNGLVLLEDGGLAAYNRVAVSFFSSGELKAVYFTEKDLVIEPAEGEPLRMPTNIPRDRRSFLLLIHPAGASG